MQGRILIADDHPLIRDALRLVITSRWRNLVVVEAGSVGEIEQVSRGRGDYALAILDLMLPDAHGFSGLILLKKLLPNTPAIMISSRQDPQILGSAHVLGAVGFVSKAMPLGEMADTFGRAMAGESAFATPPKPGARTLDVAEASRRVASLSAAQLRILLALADGRLNKQIADDMRLTEATVKAHLTAIFRKLAVNNRTQAILAARPLLESTGG